MPPQNALKPRGLAKHRSGTDSMSEKENPSLEGREQLEIIELAEQIVWHRWRPWDVDDGEVENACYFACVKVWLNRSRYPSKTQFSLHVAKLAWWGEIYGSRNRRWRGEWMSRAAADGKVAAEGVERRQAESCESHVIEEAGVWRAVLLSCTAESATDGFIEKKSADPLVNCFQQLPQHHQRSIVLFHLEDMTHEQIADRLLITEKASRNQLSRAMGKLRQLVLQADLSPACLDASHIAAALSATDVDLPLNSPPQTGGES